MAAGVMQADGAIPAPSDDIAIAYNNSANRHLALFFRATRKLERGTHELQVIHINRRPGHA